jgi:membrane-associated phospholipid phosphatase
MIDPDDDSSHSAPRKEWASRLGTRLRRHFLLKFIGITAFTWLFFIGYFHLLRHPAYPVTQMPVVAIDHLIPFQPGALFAYLTLWVYVGIAPGLQLSLLELVVYGLWAGGLCITGLALFHFLPTAVPPMTIDVSTLPAFAVLQGVDAAGNACPSMHVAVAIFSAIWLDFLLRRTGAPWMLRLGNLAWFMAIAYSTMAIKQHVALDVAAGALLGIAFALPSLYYRPNKEPLAATWPEATPDRGIRSQRERYKSGYGGTRS